MSNKENELSNLCLCYLLVCPYLQLHGIQINMGVNIKFVMDICCTL